MGEETTKVDSSKFGEWRILRAIERAAKLVFGYTASTRSWWKEKNRTYEHARDATLFAWSEDVEERLRTLEAKAEVVPQRTLDDL